MAIKNMHTYSERKLLGAFYTPNILADVLSYFVLLLNKRTEITVIDPSTGDSALLSAFHRASKSKRIKATYVGVDIDETAIYASRKKFAKLSVDSKFVNTDWLYPFSAECPSEGWSILSNEYFSHGIDIVVSNPPWGADKSQYKTLERDFDVAKGQFDIYDIFVESIVRNLSEEGVFGIIIPDSIYSGEHGLIRKFLLKNTQLTHIIRIGEGFFSEVNIAVTLLFGVKKQPTTHSIMCAHLTNEYRKKVLKGKQDLLDTIIKIMHPVSSQDMIDANYSFLTEIEKSDIDVFTILEKEPKIGQYVTSQRGVELSKKGEVICCPNCKSWNPLPRKKGKNTFTCSTCKNILTVDNLPKECIISTNRTPGGLKIIVGENIYRYNTKAKFFIEPNKNGINYKNRQLYVGSKIVVRKTGVGITAGIDYEECLTNQVVYVLKKKVSIDKVITNEVILSILNSRIITYYIIKRFGNKGWRTHAYLSQADVDALPFPRIDVKDVATSEKLNRITLLVQTYARGDEDNFPTEVDIEIERIVATLFHMNENHYHIIFETLRDVQQMIPFKRLLKISEKDLFTHGI